MKAALLTKQQRAHHFRATREHHSTEAAEDYTELIYDLTQSKGFARTGEIASYLGITHVTALRTIRRLQQLNYVRTLKHQPVELTEKGLKLALFAKERHRLLVEFFVLVGVPRAVAEVDVEGAEHHISKTTLKKVREFMATLQRLS